ncbi:MAG: mandelate racemase [Candidatus Dormibacteraeota bacterium]|uniref:Mandelate racemase n=1 Tax=Candidatus Aeolococcus gillhamiae TaxID=3127015 RepID=A0A2W6AEA0_9BACT|nr:mandelate racemase [Candidatus Dormibacteraeota bacterium]PZR83568.1 MAG: mandelate racemase [Candidatus Dormibacter sp. RRmetagenome_bin12]
MSDDLAIESVDVRVYTVPTEEPEADGTLAWDRTSLVVVQPLLRNGVRGLGYAVADPATGLLARDTLVGEVLGRDVHDTTGCWEAMVRRIRNLGRPGIASMAIAAIDIALWDTKARAVSLPLHRLLGPVREAVPIYGSGGFTSYTEVELCAQLSGWVEQGIPRVKMKIGKDRGTSWTEDLARVRAARDAIGDNVELFVDANGAYDRKQALRLGHILAEELNVTWFEEPVTSDDLVGLSQLREALPLEVTAGEYGYHLEYFSAMLAAGSVDVMQADIGRCAGVTEWLRVAATTAAYKVPFSAHCGPSIHVHPATVPPNLRHIEYFHDHVRVDHLLFEGVLKPEGGALRPADDRPGIGLSLKEADAAPFRVA